MSSGAHLTPAKQFDPRVIRRIATGRGLQLVATHVQAGGLHRVDHPGKPLASGARHRLPIARQPTGVRHMSTGGRKKLMGVEVDVEPAGGGADVGLVGRLVGREADVAIDAEDPARAEMRLQLGQQLQHRSFDLVLVLFAMGLEVPFRVVQLETLEEADEVALPALESHRRHGKGNDTFPPPCGEGSEGVPFHLVRAAEQSARVRHLLGIQQAGRAFRGSRGPKRG